MQYDLGYLRVFCAFYQTQTKVQTKTELHCEAIVIKAMKKAWQGAALGTASTERAFVVIKGEEGEISVDIAPFTNQNKQVTWKPKVPKGGRIIAIFHTHPNSGGENPSTPENSVLGKEASDTKTADALGIPIYVISSRGLTMYDPATKKNTKLRNNKEWGKSCKDE